MQASLRLVKKRLEARIRIGVIGTLKHVRLLIIVRHSRFYASEPRQKRRSWSWKYFLLNTYICQHADRESLTAGRSLMAAGTPQLSTLSTLSRVGMAGSCLVGHQAPSHRLESAAWHSEETQRRAPPTTFSERRSGLDFQRLREGAS